MRIPDTLRPSLGHVLGFMLSAVIVSAVKHYTGIEFDDTSRAALQGVSEFVADAAAAGLLGAFGALGAFFGKLFSSWFNPTDAASPHLAQVAAVPKGDGTRTLLASRLMDAIGQPVPNALREEQLEKRPEYTGEKSTHDKSPPRVDSER